MGRQEARAKGWETFRENMFRQIREDGGSEEAWEHIENFMQQRIYGSFDAWRNARTAERNRDFEKTRMLYLKAVESLEQAEQLASIPAAEGHVTKIKSEYYDFVVHRDPLYRMILKHPLLWIKEHPGILQTELYKEFPSRKREDMTYALYFAEKEGLIRREEKGRSYKLFFVREKPADEPFLKLQDDEIDIAEKAEQEAALRKGCLFVFEIALWFVAFAIAGSYVGFWGGGFVVVAFVFFQIVKKIRRKEKARLQAALAADAARRNESLPDAAQPDGTDEKNGGDEKTPVVPQKKI